MNTHLVKKVLLAVEMILFTMTVLVIKIKKANNKTPFSFVQEKLLAI